MNEKHVGLAPYRRVAEMIKDSIRSGAMKSGEKLPANRRLAEQYEVALGTAQKAVARLEDEGWVVTTPTVGVFVAAQPPDDEAASASDLSERVSQLVDAFEAFDRRLAALEQTVYDRQPAQEPPSAE